MYGQIQLSNNVKNNFPISKWSYLENDAALFGRKLSVTLYRVDQAYPSQIIIEQPPQSYVWDAVNDRLTRAATQSRQVVVSHSELHSILTISSFLRMKGKASGPLYVAMMGFDFCGTPSFFKLSTNFCRCLSKLAFVDLPEYSETA